MNPALREPWRFEPGLTYLNHGSFGATPRPILDLQTQLRDELESDPVGFLWRTLPARQDEVRLRLAAFLECDPAGLVPVPNATHAINAVLGSIDWQPGDAILLTDHGYNACQAAVEYHARRSGLEVIIVPLPWPVPPEADLAAPILAACTPRTRLAVIDHITSPTAIRLPVETLVPALKARGVETFIDGAHAPGMIDCRPDAIAATWYTGNLHKWICAPKGAAFLQTAPAWRERTFPCAISHGWNTPMEGRSRYQALFDWTGTSDPTAWLCVPETLDFMATLDPAGWSGIRRRNHLTLLDARRHLCADLDIRPPCAESLLGSMATLPFPASFAGSSAAGLRRWLREEHRIQIHTLDRSGQPWFRISHALYNRPADFQTLAAALRQDPPGAV